MGKIVTRRIPLSGDQATSCESRLDEAHPYIDSELSTDSESEHNLTFSHEISAAGSSNYATNSADRIFDSKRSRQTKLNGPEEYNKSQGLSIGQKKEQMKVVDFDHKESDILNLTPRKRHHSDESHQYEEEGEPIKHPKSTRKKGKIQHSLGLQFRPGISDPSKVIGAC
ncbi:unnamed protein product [Protopolystoma xenopodis]|uniref:Uncharacterized protein n=1 Tax=Protopolystoma xenopodis TaxID=117903 RepID=A0A448WFQ3_9PLAT|nr:unnamed protein product [Protopolystoma xenopodis]